jgi:hypothetical protein
MIMAERIPKVQARPGHRLYVEFSDVVAGVVNLSDRLFGPMFEPLRDAALFQQVSIDEFGAISWPNGADLAPDAMHERLIASGAESPTGTS